MSRDSQRVMLSPLALYGLLVKEFDRARDPRCTTCRVPLPLFRAPLDASSANWHTGFLAPCAYKCHLALGEAQARLWNHFDLRPMEDEPGPIH